MNIKLITTPTKENRTLMTHSKIIKEAKKDNYKNMNNIKHSRACRRLHQLLKANQGVVIRRKSISEV